MCLRRRSRVPARSAHHSPAAGVANRAAPNGRMVVCWSAVAGDAFKLPAVALPGGPSDRPAAPSRPSPSRPRRRGQNPAKTRLPLGGAPPLLRPPHHRRTRLLHHQRPSCQHHQPRLVPPHGPDPARVLAGRPAHRPQPARPHRMGHPPGRKPATRRRRLRPKPGNADGEPASPPRPDQTPPVHHPATHQHARRRPPPACQQAHPQPPTHQPRRTRKDQLRPCSQPTRMSDLNVNMVPTEREDHQVELRGLEPLTPCLQTTGSPSTAVHTRRSPSPSVYPRPPGSVPVAVLEPEVRDWLLRRLAAALDADVRLTAGHDLGSVWFETHAA